MTTKEHWQKSQKRIESAMESAKKLTLSDVGSVTPKCAQASAEIKSALDFAFGVNAARSPYYNAVRLHDDKKRFAGAFHNPLMGTSKTSYAPPKTPPGHHLATSIGLLEAALKEIGFNL